MKHPNKTFDHLGIASVDVALNGVVPSSIAALEQVPQAGGRLTHLSVESRGARGCILTSGQQVVHAELRSAELLVTTDRPGHLLWTGEAALRALAILCNCAVEIEIVATSDALWSHACNLDIPLMQALMVMAMAVDEGTGISALPCVLEA